MGTRARQNSLTVGWRLSLAVIVAIVAWPNVSAAQGADQRFNTVRITSTADTALCVGSVVGSSDCTGGISLSKINLGHLTDTTITRASAGVIAVEGVSLARMGATNSGTFQWGGGTAITSSDDVPRLGATANLFAASVAGGHTLGIRNSSTSASAYTAFQLGNDTGANVVQFLAVSNASTLGGIYTPNAGILEATLSAGLNLAASHASGDVRLYSRNTLALTLGASQRATFSGPMTLGGIVNLNGFRISGDGDNEGMSMDNSGNAVFTGDMMMNATSGTFSMRATGSSQNMTLLWENSSGDDIARIVSNTGVGDLVFYPYPNTTPALTLKATTRALEVGGNVVLGSYYLSGDGGNEGISVDSSGNVTMLSSGNGLVTINSGGQYARLRFTPQATTNEWDIVADDASDDLYVQFNSGTTFLTFDASGTDIDFGVNVGGAVNANFSTFSVAGSPGCTGTPTASTSGINTTCASPEAYGDWVLGLPTVAAEMRSMWNELTMLRSEISRLSRIQR